MKRLNAFKALALTGFCFSPLAATAQVLPGANVFGAPAQFLYEALKDVPEVEVSSPSGPLPDLVKTTTEVACVSYFKGLKYNLNVDCNISGPGIAEKISLRDIRDIAGTGPWIHREGATEIFEALPVPITFDGGNPPPKYKKGSAICVKLQKVPNLEFECKVVAL